MYNSKLLKAIAWFQAQEDHHPLTCGKDSTHALLGAHIQNDTVVLKCKDCGYIQNVPECVLSMYQEYCKLGWVHNHKQIIIGELKNLIDDVEDDHYKSTIFFNIVEERVKKWREESQDKDDV